VTAFRLISLPTHAALELLLALALMIAPFALSFGAGGTVVAVVLGAVLAGLALAGAGEPSGLRVATHFAFDQTIVVVLVGAALAVGLAGDRAAALVLAAASAAQLALSLTTRYSTRGA
jgi:hypothetical protein